MGENEGLITEWLFGVLLLLLLLLPGVKSFIFRFFSFDFSLFFSFFFHS